MIASEDSDLHGVYKAEHGYDLGLPEIFHFPHSSFPFLFGVED